MKQTSDAQFQQAGNRADRSLPGPNKERGEEAVKQERGWNMPGHQYSRRQAETGRVFRTMNFERYAAEGNYFINQVADELDVDRNSAARITKAVLHAVRDRIPPADAIEFAQGLPMALKGIYFDQYDLAKVPVVLRHPEEFLDFVCYKDGKLSDRDFPYREFVEDAIAAVFRVLERKMSYGQVERVKRMMNDEIAYLFY